jgi:Ca-activated chloride channel family protein
LEKTLSPYFQVEGGDPRVDALPLLKTRVEVTVSGTIAAVTVRQTYKNDGKRPINARYVFPASTRAAVHGMKMRLDGREIIAQIRERQKAQQEYEEAKKQGKTAALLEQQRPNVFTMSVANVMPKDRIEVTLFYTETLVPARGVYEFVYPTVVGPRYSHEQQLTAKQSDLWVKSPYQRKGNAPSYAFELQAHVAAALPIAGVTVPSHRVTQTPRGKKAVDVSLTPDEKAGGNRDFILRYRLAGDAIQSGISLFQQGNEKFFMAMIEPPKTVLPRAIPSREYVFVVDVSGSMHGFPLDTAKELMRDLVAELEPRDRFNVLLFSGGSALMAERSLPATQTNIERAEQFLSSATAGGGTELAIALERALALPATPGMSRSFVVVTDGYISAERSVFDYVRSTLGQANVFSFGIGSGVNRHLIEGLARAGLGEPFVVTDAGEGQSVAKRFRRYVSQPVLTNVKVSFHGFDAYDVEPKAISDVFV